MLFKSIINFHKHEALITENAIYTYGDLLQEIESVTNQLRSVLSPGEVVALVSDYSLQSIALLLALCFNSNIIVPIVSSDSGDLAQKLKVAYVDKVISYGAGGLLVKEIKSDPKHDLVLQLQNSGDAGLILFSSGTTGKPKAMLHNLTNMLSYYEVKQRSGLRQLMFLLFDHIGGIQTLFQALVEGDIIVIPTKREPEYICHLIQEHKINIIHTTPTFLNLLLISCEYQRHDFSSLKLIRYGAETMSEALLYKLNTIFPSVRFLQGLGTSETGLASVTSKSNTSTLMKLNGDLIQHKVVNNELWLKSKTQILGYLNEDFTKVMSDGWFMTGDLVESDVDGYFRVLGRVRELINVGGQKVLPAEVEAVLLQYDGIVGAIVYAEPNYFTQQMVIADVVLAGGSDSIDKSELQTFCLTKMERYKVPIKINIVQDLRHSARYKKLVK